MKLGLFGMPIHPASRDLADALEADANRVILADELGFEEAFIGEHHTCATEPIASPLMFLASLIHRTKNIKLGSGVVALPLNHPVKVAAEVAQFDHMARGRFIFGIGQGSLPSDMEVYDAMDGEKRTEMMHESLDIIKQLWSGEPPFRFKTKHYDLTIEETVMKDLSIGVPIKPFQQPHPPIAATAMSPHSSSVEQAVLQGWIPMSSNFTPISVVHSHWGKIREAYDEMGQEATGQNWRVARNVLVANSDQEALDRMLDPESPHYFYCLYLWKLFLGLGAGAIMNDTGKPDDEVSIEEIVSGIVIHGSPDTVAEKLTAIREQSPFGTLLMAMLDGSSASHEANEQESMRLMATEVLPKLA